MMALLGTVLFGSALVLVAQIFLDTLLPALPRIVALLRSRQAPGATIAAVPARRPTPRVVTAMAPAWRAAA
ncbi:MAG: hypothetical protein A4S16_12365 [Proteobacteria bacterium SG_bin6]|nr:MAG: hypothetical protein A4S16_12365 [Proteobacteria bacterium SG_bin6]